jgi:D-alanyl-D-alanine carboxypeptidase/D-alanyl-D-alanine-endopeptidase (penicillin-binding protein 4)
LAQAYQDLVEDSQAKYAITSLCVLDAQTGKVVFAKNENIGLATASTLKTITSATAFSVLGKDFSYQTTLAYSGKITAEGVLQGDIAHYRRWRPNLRLHGVTSKAKEKVQY